MEQSLVPALVVILGAILVQLRRIETRLDKQHEYTIAQAAVMADALKKLAVAITELAHGVGARAREQSAVDAFTGSGA